MPDPYREPIEEETPSLPPPDKKVEKPVLAEIPEIKKLQEKPLSAPPPEVVTPAPAPTAPSPAAPPPPPADELKVLDQDRQLKILVDLAFQQGLDKAVEAARATENPYLIDKFHDTLVDELRQKLIEKGKLKEL